MYMSDVKRVLNQLQRAFANIRKMYPIENSKLKHNGDIYYLNANDGTQFDWLGNYRTCEFAILYPNDECYAFLSINHAGEIDGYVYYPNSSAKGVFEDLGCVGEEEAEEFAAYLQKYADNKGVWDELISKINFNGTIRDNEVRDFVRGESDDDDYDDDDEDTMYGRSFRAPRKHLRKNPKDALNVRRMRGCRAKVPVRRSTPKKRIVPAKKRSPLPSQKNCPVKVNVRKMF